MQSTKHNVEVFALICPRFTVYHSKELTGLVLDSLPKEPWLGYFGKRNLTPKPKQYALASLLVSQEVPDFSWYAWIRS